MPRFVELWRVGGTNEGEELAFPLNAAVSGSGRLAIADFGLGELIVIDPDGTWLDPWATAGQGPNELASPVAAVWTDEGSEVAVFDLPNGKVVFLREGPPVREGVAVPVSLVSPVYASGELAWAGVMPSGSALVQPALQIEGRPTRGPEAVSARSLLIRSRPGTEVLDTVASVTLPTVGGDPPYGRVGAPGWPTVKAAISADGSLAVGGEDASYRIRMNRPGRARPLVVCRAAPPLPFEDREQRIPETGEPAADLEAAIAGAVRPDSLAPFGRLFISQEGHLWVQRDRPSALRSSEGYNGVSGALYDVFGADGSYLGDVRAPANARLQAALGDTVWAYETGELDETWVVAYHLDFAGP